MSWPIGKVADIATIISGYAFKSEWFGSGSAKIIRIGNLQNNRVLDDDVATFDAETYQVSEQFKIMPGDILMALSGATVGKIAVAEQKDAGSYLNQRVAIVRGKSAENSGWLKYIFSGELLHNLLMNAGGAAQPNLSPKSLSELQIPLPPLPEQKRIAAILDKADELKRKRETAIAKLDQLAQCIFVEMFGDVITNERGWKKIPLKNAVDSKYGIKAGPFGSSLKKEEYVASGYKIYGQEQVIAGNFDIGDYYITENKFNQLSSCAVKEGDVLVSLVGSFGKVLVVPKGIHPGIINPRLLKITPDFKQLDSEFLAATLQNHSVQRWLSDQAHGGTMGILNGGLLKELQIVIPPLSAQNEFISRVKFLEKLKLIASSALAKQNNLFTSLQHQAFAGHL